MRNFKIIFFFIIIFLFQPIHPKDNKLVFHGAYTFETFKGQKAAAAYVSIFNNTEMNFKVNSIVTDISNKAEIHDVFIKEDIVKMKKLDNLVINAKDQVYMQPGGMHIMLMGLNKELKDGSFFFINFLFDNKTSKKVKVLVLNKKMRENFIN